MQPPSINSAVSALRFFFTVTLDRPDLARRLTVVPQPRRIPAVLSVEEVTLLLRAASAPKYKAAFATAGACPRAGRRPDPWGAGLRVSEVVALKAGDIDSERMLLRVERGKGRKSLPSRKRGTATRCSRRSSSNYCAPGGGRGGGTACCCREAGCSRPEPGRAAVSPPAQLRRPCRGPGRRDQEAGVATYAAAQLCHASTGTGHRHPRHSGAPRSRDILPGTRSRGGFTTRFIPGAASPCSLPDNMPTVVLSWSLFRSPTARSLAYPRG
jgi:hypothetical protein